MYAKRGKVARVASPLLSRARANKTYDKTFIQLLMASEPNLWIRYKLDLRNPIEISWNITLSGLACGMHYLTVYATDASGNTCISKIICFTMTAESETFPTTIVAASGASAAIIGMSLLVHLIRSNHRAERLPRNRD